MNMIICDCSYIAPIDVSRMLRCLCLPVRVCVVCSVVLLSMNKY